jgi:FkbM family methyltransferase
MNRLKRLMRSPAVLDNRFGAALRRLMGRPRHGEQVSLEKVHLGTRYGGYAVAPALLSAQSIVYSFGLGEDVSFDLAILERVGCTVHGFDPTPRSLAWVARQNLPASFHLHAVGLSDRDGTASFAPPENPAHVSHRIVPSDTKRDGTLVFEVKRLTTLMTELGHTRVDVLKMDIESAEYAVIDALAKSSVRPGQILVEFHHQMPGITLLQTEQALARLNSVGYRIFDCQPGGREFSLVLTAMGTGTR